MSLHCQCVYVDAAVVLLGYGRIPGIGEKILIGSGSRMCIYVSCCACLQVEMFSCFGQTS